MVELNEKAVEVGQRVEKFTGEARWFGTILSTYTTGRGKIRHVVEVEPQGFQMIAVPEQLRPAPALPAPVRSVAERPGTEKFTLLAMASNYRHGHLWDQLDRGVCERAAAEIDAKDEQIERLTREVERFVAAHALEAKKRSAAEQQVQKLTADKASALGLLNHLISWIVHDCGAEVPFTDEQDAVFADLETQEGGE